uniref:Uncharacterized protein n=1 Tax=Cacopsylla melanoneura TaxID=428564 RepID=A0A8D8RDE3_9HEMI
MQCIEPSTTFALFGFLSHVVNGESVEKKIFEVGRDTKKYPYTYIVITYMYTDMMIKKEKVDPIPNLNVSLTIIVFFFTLKKKGPIGSPLFLRAGVKALSSMLSLLHNF